MHKSSKDLSLVFRITTLPNVMLQWCCDHTGNIVMDITMFYVIFLVINANSCAFNMKCITQYFYCGLKLIR